MAKGTCSIESCNKVVQSLGLCCTHYQRQRRAAKGPCSVAGCDAVQYSSDLCCKHYQRQRRTGTTDLAPQIKPCAVRGCPTPARVRGWCIKHHGRWKRIGDPLTTVTRERLKASRSAMIKKCIRCNRELPIDHFDPRPQMLDGRRSNCRECGRLYNNESNARKREREAPYRLPKESTFVQDR